MIILVGILLLLVPYIIGQFTVWVLDHKSKNKIQSYLSGCLTIMILSGISQAAVIFMHLSFTDYKRFLSILLGVFLLLGAAVRVGSYIKNKEKLPKFSMPKISKAEGLQGAALLLLLLMGFAVCAVKLPDTSGDFTLETVHTTLTTDTIYEYNSFTGLQIEEGMPIRQQILTVPFFMAYLSSIFSLEAESLIYGLIPCWVFLLSFFAYGLWAEKLFPQNAEHRRLFLCFWVMLILLGDYGVYSLTHLLLTQGFTGNAWLVGVIIPFTIYLCMKRKWVSILLPLVAEVFLVWTTYGLGFSVIVVVIFAILTLISTKKGEKLCI